MAEQKTNIAQRLAVAAYNDRQRQKGWLRANLVLSPEDTTALGRLMAIWGVSRQEAVRRAIRLTWETALERETSRER